MLLRVCDDVMQWSCPICQQWKSTTPTDEYKLDGSKAYSRDLLKFSETGGPRMAR